MIRVFPRMTKWTPVDELAFVGDPPLEILRPPEQPVYVSIAFERDIPEGERLQRGWSEYYSDVRIGGPALGDPGGDFVPGRFIKKGVTITSRGCPRECPWCFVPRREGKLRELPIQPGWIIQDNNLLACSRSHFERVIEMLQQQRRRVSFTGGLDARYLAEWHIDALKTINVREMWFACDTLGHLPALEHAISQLQAWPAYKRRCYVMVGYGDETIVEAEYRLKRVYELGFLPFAQLYKGPGQQVYDRRWLALNKKWSRPALYRTQKGFESRTV